MSLLLAAPAVGIMLLQALPVRRRAVSVALIMAQVQVGGRDSVKIFNCLSHGSIS